MKEMLIQDGVARLKEFGYPDVNEENILTDRVYKAFFKKMLAGIRGIHPVSDEAINEILSPNLLTNKTE